MSDENCTDGKDCYSNGDAETCVWFERQWQIWPTRAHPDRTTNLSFHHGGVLAFREANGHDPKMSRDFASQVARLDRYMENSHEG